VHLQPVPDAANIRTVNPALHLSPFPGAKPDWPRCAYCNGTPVKVYARRDDASSSALFCAECAQRVRDDDEAVAALVLTR
jgi:hypothetical protein